MEISKGYIKEMVRYAEQFNALSLSAPISEYKDWIVQVSIEKRELLVEK